MASHVASTSFNLPADKSILDAVTFAATLVSRPSEIDAQLDRIRSITATRGPEQFTSHDKQVLREVYDYIEEYLVKKETLRSFTRDSVRQRVYDYLSGKRATHLRVPLAIMWAIAVAGAVGANLLPESILPASIKPTLGVVLFFVTVHLGAAWMFWTGLRNFKDRTRWAYLPICIGIILVGITMLQVPLALAIGQYDSLWFRYGSSGIFITVAAGLIYTGVRRFASLSGVTNKLMSLPVIASLCIAIATIMSILPRPESDVPAWVMIASFFILVTGAVLAFASAALVAITRKALGVLYKRPMAWFIASLIISGLTFAQFAVLQIVAEPNNPYETQGFATLPLVISAFVLLKASTSFRKIDTTIVRGEQIINSPTAK